MLLTAADLLSETDGALEHQLLKGFLLKGDDVLAGGESGNLCFSGRVSSCCRCVCSPVNTAPVKDWDGHLHVSVW